ncbi:MAG: sugar phosphate nucleotidyltransferase, partial [Sediminibacterium sp.]|nr:sugar phosphate nucleotidyltransferase [Sediminibacterium sp.]
MKAMIFAAGFGTRLQPFTNEHPKALLKINGKYLLEHAILYLQKYNLLDIVVNVHHFANQIIEVVLKNNGWGSNIIISEEKDILETGGGLLFAKNHFIHEQNFVVLNADILTNMPLDKMIAQHKMGNNIATLATSNRASKRQLLFNEHKILCGWQHNSTQEKKIIKSYQTITPLAFNGIHIINTRFFDELTLTHYFSMIDAYLQIGTLQNIGFYDASAYH